VTYDPVSDTYVAVAQDTGMNLGNDGFAILVIVVLAGIIFIDVAWELFRGNSR